MDKHFPGNTPSALPLLAHDEITQGCVNRTEKPDRPQTGLQARFPAFMARALAALLLFSFLGMTPPLQAEEPPPPHADRAQEKPTWEAEANVTWSSKYIWRGINVVDRSVLQPSLTARRGGLSANAWGNLDLTNQNGHSGDFTEIDLSLDYTWQSEWIELSLGTIYYTFPHSSAGLSTTEVYGAMSWKGPLSPTLTTYLDVDEAGGHYWNLSVEHTFENCMRMGKAPTSLVLGAAVGYGSRDHNAFYYGADTGGFTDGRLSASLPIQLNQSWSVAPFVRYSWLMDGELRDSLRNDDNLWAGLSISHSF